MVQALILVVGCQPIETQPQPHHMPIVNSPLPGLADVVQRLIDPGRWPPLLLRVIMVSSQEPAGMKTAISLIVPAYSRKTGEDHYNGYPHNGKQGMVHQRAENAG